MKEKVSQDELKTQLLGKVEGIVNGWREDPAQIAEYLCFAARFPDYSHANTRLLFAQNPNISFIASASAFRAGLRNKNGVPLSESPIWIKKGERALRIWAPTVRTYVKNPESGGWEQYSHLTPVEQERAKVENWETREARGFVLVPVFDVSQTTLPPELYPRRMGYGRDGEDSEVYFRAARAYAEGELHCPVHENVDMRSALIRGTFSPASNEIRLSELLRGEGKLSTLVHEIGHAELHADPAAASLSASQMELEADMYALMLEHTMGIPTTDARKAHLSEHYKAYLRELQREAKDKTLTLGADSAPFENVIRRYRQQLPKIEEYIELAKEAALQEAEAEQVQQSMRVEQVEQEVADTFTIYQLKDGEEMRAYRFAPLERLRSEGLAVDASNYEAVYTAQLPVSETLEDIYLRFNMERPADFTGRSLSVSDIVVLQRDGTETAHYCDSFGFTEVPEFLRQAPAQETQREPAVTPLPDYGRTSNLSF